MPMDAVFLHGLTQELTQSLTGARIDKVQQPERDLLLLSVRKPSGALPGMVLYTDYQTCMAESDEALVERLRAR